MDVQDVLKTHDALERTNQNNIVVVAVLCVVAVVCVTVI